MKNLYLLTFSFLLASCFEEEPVSGFLTETTWIDYKSGSVYENDKYLYSYMETHTLTFGKSTFIYKLNRKETVGNGPSYKDKLNEQVEGTYAVKYPNLYLSAEAYERTGYLSITSSGMGVLTIDSDKPGESLSFVKEHK
jgi:hypothetical protein